MKNVIKLHKRPVDEVRDMLDGDEFDGADVVVLLTSSIERDEDCRYTNVFFYSDDRAKLVYALSLALNRALEKPENI